MKILKWVGIVVLVLAVVFCVGGLLLPDHTHVERTAVVEASPEQVYTLVSNTRMTKNWSPWFELDSNMKTTYTGPESGVGSAYSWTSDVWNVGNGSYKITEATPNSSVSSDMNFGEGMDAKARFIIVPKGKVSKVTWTFDSDSEGNLLSRWMGALFMNSMLGSDYEKGLSNMSAAAQKIVVGRIGRLEQYNCEGGFGLGIRSTISMSSIGETLARSYSTIMQYMSSKHITMQGFPTAFYHTWDGKSTDMEAVIPIAKFDAGNDNVKPVAFAKGPMIIAHYYGPYEGTEKAHTACEQWLKENGKTAKGAPFEEYVTDPGTEKDQSKWLTKVSYYY